MMSHIYLSGGTNPSTSKNQGINLGPWHLVKHLWKMKPRIPDSQQKRWKKGQGFKHIWRNLQKIKVHLLKKGYITCHYLRTLKPRFSRITQQLHAKMLGATRDEVAASPVSPTASWKSLNHSGVMLLNFRSLREWVRFKNQQMGMAE